MNDTLCRWLLMLLVLVALPLGGAAATERLSLPLNERWQCAVDPDGAALRGEWARAMPVEAPTVTLPFAWDDLPLTRAAAVVWYSRDLTFPAESGESGVELVIANPVGMLEVFLDGDPVALLCGNGLTRRVRLTGPPQTTHRLALRLDHRSMPLALRDGARCGLGPITLEVRPPVRVESLLPIVQPDLQTVTVRYRVVADFPCQATLRLELQQPNGHHAFVKETFLVELGPTPLVGERTLVVQDPRPWTPEQPQLCRVRAILSLNKREDDTRTEEFGLRVITLTGDGLRVNGAPIMLKGLRLPGGILPALPAATPRAPSPLWQAADGYMREMKAAGFNAVMADGPALPAEICQLADRLGMFVVAEVPPTPNPQVGDAEATRLDYDAVVDTLGHHASIIAYTWKGGDAADVAALRARDPGRLLLPRLGIASQVVAPFAATPQPAINLDATIGLPLSPVWQGVIERAETGGQPFWISHLRFLPSEGISCANLCGEGRFALSVEEACAVELRGMVERLRRSACPIGYFIRPERGGNFTGLRTADALPTRAALVAANLNQALTIALQLRADGKLDATLINERGWTGLVSIYRAFTRPNGSTSLRIYTVQVHGERRQPLAVMTNLAQTEAGTYQVQLMLVRGSDTLDTARATLCEPELKVTP